MARFGRRIFKRLKVTTATRRGTPGKPARIYIKKPGISQHKIRKGL